MVTFPPFEEDRMPDEAEQAQPHYVWFPATTVRVLRARLNDASDDAIVKVVGHGERMTLEVLEPESAGLRSMSGPLNDAHQCPPACLGADAVGG